VADEPAVEERTIVAKHHLLVRLSHWLNVPILAAMIVSGLAIYWASPVHQHPPDRITGSRDYLADAGAFVARHIAVRDVKAQREWFYNHFSIGVFQLAQALRLHWLFAYLFMLVGLMYVIGIFRSGSYRAVLPRRGDVRESFAMIRYYLRLGKHPVVTSKYNALQRGAYASVPLFGVLAIASGWAMHKPAQLGWLARMFGSYDGARFIHFWTMWAFIAFAIPHVFLAIADGWDTLRSMVTGWSARTGAPHE
jgi:thiosulfate reductase cytochrome b subunit